MDLFRHTTQLGIHTESCIGYSHCVCSTLKTSRNQNDPHYVYSIEKMYAIPVAGNAMIWYTGKFIVSCLVLVDTILTSATF
jgi:superkiller protein 3